MSTFSCPVVKFRLKPHSNADTLSIAEVKGWEVVVRTNEFESEQLGAYIPLDAVAPADHPFLGFLEGKKVKAVKLRGVVSMGVLLPLSRLKNHYEALTDASDWEEGKDVSSILGVKKWIDTRPVTTKVTVEGKSKVVTANYEVTKWPDWLLKYTDIENWNNYSNVIQDKELVHVSLKLHGANAVFAKIDGEYFVCSRNRSLRTKEVTIQIPKYENRLVNRILKLVRLNKHRRFLKDHTLPVPKSVWHRAFNEFGIGEKLDKLSAFYKADKVAIYGEVVGVQDLNYGLEVGNIDFYAFDIRTSACNSVENYLPPSEFESICTVMKLKKAPNLYTGPFHSDILNLKEGPDPIGKSHVREGIVIKPVIPRWDRKLGRVCLKKVGDGYLLRKNQRDE